MGYCSYTGYINVYFDLLMLLCNRLSHVDLFYLNFKANFMFLYQFVDFLFCLFYYCDVIAVIIEVTVYH